MKFLTVYITCLQVKTAVKDDIFRSAGAVVDQALVDNVNGEADLPNPDALKRKAQRTSQKERPRDSVDLDFEVGAKMVNL